MTDKQDDSSWSIIVRFVDFSYLTFKEKIQLGRLIACICLCSGDIEMHIMPVIMSLAEPDSPDDFRADAVLASLLSFIFGI